MGRFFGGISATAGRPVRPQTSVQQFGSEELRRRENMPIPSTSSATTLDAITSRLISYQVSGDYRLGDGRLVVYLDNGQEWIQAPGGDPDRADPAPRRAMAPRYGAALTGAYLMRLTGVLKVIYVRRRR